MTAPNNPDTSLATVLADAAAMVEWLNSQCGEHEHCTAVIDPTRYASVEGCAAALGLGVAFDELANLYGHFSPAVGKWGPRLFTAPPDHPSWELIGAEAIKCGAASFVVAPKGSADLYLHLKSLVKLPQPDGSRLLFRFQDTTVLAALAALLTPPQRNSLLGPGVRWLVLDVCGKPITIERGVLKGPVLSSLVLGAPQMEALDFALMPGTLIVQANDTDSALLAGMDKCSQWKAMRELHKRAREHGLDAHQDIALFCVLSLQLPLGFDMDGPVARALDRTKHKGIGFSTAIDEVPVEEWRAWDRALDMELKNDSIGDGD